MELLPLPNTTIDSYHIIQEIGRGGMAHIFEAEHVETKRRVALKMLATSNDADRLTERFEQEFKALSRLNHPNVLQVYECGTFGNRPYFTMELLQGTTLKEVISQWMLIPPTERFSKARHTLLQMAAALDHIHQYGWIHRDVTPSNIMVLNDGTIKLMDFGVVKIPGTERTIAGEMIGTVAYMAPEQIQNQTLDSRTDLYSLGATLYLVLTGHRPFNAKTLGGYLQKHLQETPAPPSSYSPMLPKDLEETCLRLLEKSPDDRFASANHLLQFISLSTTIIKERRLFGRTREMHLLQEKIASLALGQGGIVLLEGSNGMGKTQLLQAAARLLKQFDVPHTFCKSRSPQQPMYETFQPLLNELSHNERSTLFQDKAKRDDSWEFFAQIRTLMNTAQTRCILLDNIERSDAASLRLLEFMINASLDDGLPILFIVTIDNDSSDIAFDTILSEKKHLNRIKRIPVLPLKPAAVEEWLLCFATNEPNIKQMAERLFIESEGAPFILDEMIKALRSSNVLSSNIRGEMRIDSEEIQTIPLPLSDSIQASILERFQELPLLERHIIDLLTVSEQGLSFELLLEILNALYPDRKTLELPDLQIAIQHLLEIDLVQHRDVESQIIVEVAHQWYKEIFLPNISAEMLRKHHHCLGVALERQHLHNINRIVETLAYHFEQARSYGKAYAYLWQSACKLRYRSLFYESRSYLDRAYRIEPMAREHIALYEADQKLAEVFLTHSFLSHQLNDTEQAQKMATRADQLAGEQHNYALMAKVATEKARQARDLYNLAEADLQIKRALQYADRAGQPTLSILPLYENGALLWDKGEPEQARTLFEKALELSEQLHHSFGIAKANNGLGVLAMSLGDSAQARKNFEAAISHSTEHHRIEDLVIARTNLSELFHCIGYFKKALVLLNTTISESLEYRFEFGVSIALRHSAILLIDLGKYAEAREQAQSALEINRSQHNQQEYLASLVVWLRCHFSSGNWHSVGPRLEEALQLLPLFDSEGYSPIVYSWNARLQVHLHKDIEGAVVLLERAVTLVKPNRKFQEVRCMLNIARGWKAVGYTEQAVHYGNLALALANQSGYRYYAMRSRQLLSTVVSDSVLRSRHHSIAEALTRSLASSLSKSDATSFLSRNLLQ